MPRSRSAAVAAALLLPLLAGCGDDDSADASAETTGDLAAYCEAAFEWNTPPDPEDHEFDQDWVDSVLRPRFERLEALAPDAVADDLASVAAALEGGDEAEGQAAAHRITRFSADECGWRRVELTAVEYAFDGAPETVPAGIVSFEVTNEGDEAHMVKIVRRNDGVTTPFAELLALPEERQDELLEGFEPEDFAEPGDLAITVADLRPGHYALVCELPVGTADLEAGLSDGATHASAGMVHQFTVE